MQKISITQSLFDDETEFYEHVFQPLHFWRNRTKVLNIICICRRSEKGLASIYIFRDKQNIVLVVLSANVLQ